MITASKDNLETSDINSVYKPFVQLRALQLDLIRFTLQYPPSW